MEQCKEYQVKTGAMSKPVVKKDKNVDSEARPTVHKVKDIGFTLPKKENDSRETTPTPSILLNEPNIPEELEPTKGFWDETGTATYIQASQYAEVGKFQIFLLIVCVIAFSTTSTIPSILTKYSSAIQCDYQLIREDRKAINDVVYICMIVGGAAWSLLADTLSRKWTLVSALLVYAGATCGLTVAPTFVLFGLCRGIGAFSLSGIQCMTIAYLSEFQVRLFRGSMICCLQLGWILGMITVPILPYTWKSKVILSVIPPIIAAVGVLLFPDPPRFLLSRGRAKEALKVLRMIHGTNTGKTEFPIRFVKDNISPAEIRRTSVVKSYIPSHLEPKFICIPLLMFSQFVMMFSYYTLAIWFPDMVTRSDAFFPLQRVANIPQDCKVGLYAFKEEPARAAGPPHIDLMQAYNPSDKNSVPSPSFQVIDAQPENPCHKGPPRWTYKSSVMDALACMPSLIWLVVKIDSIGRIFYITFSHILAGCLTFFSYFMHGVAKGMLFCTIFDALALLSISTAHCLAVDLFPTRMRVLGIALVIGSGQLGTILAHIGGAVSFGLSCVVVVSSIAIALAISGILIVILPDTTGVALK